MKSKLAATTLLSVFIVAGSASAGGNLVAHWPLDSHGNLVGYPGHKYVVTDEVECGIESHIYGEPPLISEVSGIIDDSIYFPGTAGVHNTSSPNCLDFGTGDFSFSFWVKPDSLEDQVFARKGTIFIFDLTTDGELRVQLGIGFSYTLAPAIYKTVQAEDYLIENAWHNLVFSLDHTNGAQFYIDGQEITTTSIVTDPSFNANLNGVELAPDSAGFGSYPLNTFSGRMDDVKFFSDALSLNDAIDSMEEAGLGACCSEISGCSTNVYIGDCHEDLGNWNPQATTCSAHYDATSGTYVNCVFGMSIPGGFTPRGFTPA